MGISKDEQNSNHNFVEYINKDGNNSNHDAIWDILRALCPELRAKRHGRLQKVGTWM